MQIRDIMKRSFEVVALDTDVRSAAIKMRDTGMAVISVCDGPRFAGILTDRDIAVRLAAEGYDATRTRVGEIMTRDLTYCFEDQTIDEATIVMQFHQISHLPVLDRAQQLIGVVSMADISAWLKIRANPIPPVTTEPAGVEDAPALAGARTAAGQ
jgi:CBS domain-containing protein